MKLIHRHNEKLQEIEELTKKLEESPAFQAFEKEEAGKTLQKRQETADKIKVLRQEEAGLSVARSEIEELEKKLSEMDSKRQALQAEVSEKRGKLAQKKAGFEGQIRVQEEILFNSYDSKIDEAIEFFRKKLDKLRSPGKISTIHAGGVRNIFTGKKKDFLESNLGSIRDALKYCQDSIQSLEQAKLQPVLDMGKVQAMKDSIPKIDVYSASERERQMPGFKVPSAESSCRMM